MPLSPPTLRPFFSFYGGKWRDAPRHYPPPLHSLIIEPFAGSAGYALRHPEKQVLLLDSDPVIAGVWSYLLAVSPAEILAIPDVNEHIDELSNLPEEARHLVGFWLNRAPSAPRCSPSAWMRSGIRPGSFWGPRVRTTIATQLEFIRHWRVRCASYEEAPDTTATWFVDPPYQHAGKHYRHGADRIDYAVLAAWCRSRDGQVVVCEQDGADWLPFSPLAAVKTTRRSHRSAEVAWLGP